MKQSKDGCVSSQPTSNSLDGVIAGCRYYHVGDYVAFAKTNINGRDNDKPSRGRSTQNDVESIKVSKCIHLFHVPDTFINHSIAWIDRKSKRYTLGFIWLGHL